MMPAAIVRGTCELSLWAGMAGVSFSDFVGEGLRYLGSGPSSVKSAEQPDVRTKPDMRRANAHESGIDTPYCFMDCIFA
jgi:hypothetical protein